MLNSEERKLYVIMKEIAKDKVVNTAVKSLAVLVECSRSKTIKTLEVLEKKSYIRKYRQKDKMNNQYEILKDVEFKNYVWGIDR